MVKVVCDMKYCYMLVENTNYELPIDVALNLKELSLRHHIPLQTLKNACSDGRIIRYINCKVERIRIQ